MADDWESAFSSDDEGASTNESSDGGHKMNKDGTQQTTEPPATVLTPPSSAAPSPASSSSDAAPSPSAPSPPGPSSPPQVQAEMLDLISGSAKSQPQEIFEPVLEMYFIPPHFKSPDILKLLNSQHESIKWLTDTQAFIFFKTPFAADLFYKQFSHHIIKLRPASKAHPDHVRLIEEHLPARAKTPPRPEKDATVAKRLISNIIGAPRPMRTEEERQRDKEQERLRKERREQFRQAEKLKQEAWEG